MSISVACPSCGRKFQAPPQFEGKRVKCKGCSEIFAVPVSGQPAEVEADIDETLATLAQSVRAPGRPTAARSTGATATVEDDESASRNALAPNVLTFKYPGADDVDRWLPACLTVVCFLLLAGVVNGPETHGAVWIAITRFATMSLFYSMVIFPLTLMLLKKASRETKFAMPPQAQLRCFATYMPAFLMAAWFFSQENAGLFIPFIGCVLGLGISSAVLWLLFRLREPDIVTYAVQGAGGFLGGLLASIALIVILNMTVEMMVTDAKGMKSVPTSPFAAGLSWVGPTPLPATDTEQTGDVGKVATTTGLTTKIPPKTSTPKTSKTSPVASTSTLVDHIETGKIPGLIDGVIEPLSTSPTVAILRNQQGGISIEPWNIQDWQKSTGTLQLPAGAAKKFVLSTDGQKLAWIAEFPRLSIQVWSFADAMVSSAIPLDKAQGGADLIGFVDPNRLLIERGTAKSTAEANSPVADNTPATPAPADDVPDAQGPDSVFSGFKNNPAELARQHALGNKGSTTHEPAENFKPTTPSPQDTASAHAMEIIDTNSGTTVCTFGLPTLVTDFVAAAGQVPGVFKASLHLGSNVAISTTGHRLVAATTVQETPTLMQIDLLTGKRLPSIKIAEIDPTLSGSLTGLAYSNDGTELATLFEHNESALLLAYNAAMGKKTGEHNYPFGPVDSAQHSQPEDGAIAWLDPAPLWLLYGQGFINSKTGVHLKSADLGLGTIVSQRVLDGNRIELLLANDGGRQVNVVNLNPSADNADSKP